MTRRKWLTICVACSMLGGGGGLTWAAFNIDRYWTLKVGVYSLTLLVIGFGGP
jgi:hypothetical protein